MDARFDRELHRAAVDRALGRELGERIALTADNLEEVAKLESIFADWQRAPTVKRASLVLHRAVLDVDPLAADIWVPRLLRRRGGSRARFSQGLRVLWRARERGQLRGNLAEEALALLCEGLDWQAAGVGAAPAPAHGARRCEGRSRAPQGSAGGTRAGSGGSRRGGDRGDGSGGGGSDGSGGGSSGSGGSRRRRVNWPAVGGVCAVATLLITAAAYFAPLHSEPTPVTVTPKVVVMEVQTPAPAGGSTAPKAVRPSPSRPHSGAEARVEP